MKITHGNDVKPQSYCIQVKFYCRKFPWLLRLKGLHSCETFCSSNGDHQEGYSCIGSVDTFDVSLIRL